MPYNYIYVDPGTGRKVATDQYVQGADTLDLQIVKLAHGADGAVDGLVDDAAPLPVALPAHVAITVAPTIQAAAYHAGDSIGGKLAFANAVRAAGKGGTLQAVIIADKGKQNAAIDLVLFNADPSGTTFTENAALAIADADLLNAVGHIVVATADYCAFADNSLATHLVNPGVPFVIAGGTSLYAALVMRGTPTYTSTTDLQVTLVIKLC